MCCFCALLCKDADSGRTFNGSTVDTSSVSFKLGCLILGLFSSHDSLATQEFDPCTMIVEFVESFRYGVYRLHVSITTTEESQREPLRLTVLDSEDTIVPAVGVGSNLNLLHIVDEVIFVKEFDGIANTHTCTTECHACTCKLFLRDVLNEGTIGSHQCRNRFFNLIKFHIVYYLVYNLSQLFMGKYVLGALFYSSLSICWKLW